MTDLSNIPRDNSGTSAARAAEVEGSRAGVGFAVLIALWLGFGTGFTEGSLIVFRKLALDRFVWVSADALWVLPLVHGTIFLATGLALFACSRLTPRLLAPSRRVGLLAALGTFSILLNYGPLHPLAGLVLSMGIGAVAGRLWRRAPDRLGNVVRRTILPLAALVVLTFGAVTGWRVWRERSNQPLGETPNGPNVLLLVLDTVRAMDLSVYGYDQPTSPALEQFAKGGVLFRHAIAPAPWTLPSHASLFTGRWPFEMHATWRRPMGRAYPTLAERLRDIGYSTSGFVANARYCSLESGLGRGFGRYEDYSLTPAQSLTFSALGRWLVRDRYRQRQLLRISADNINRRFLRWLDSERDDRPFFAFLNYLDAHGPYQPPEPFAGRFSEAGYREQLRPHREDIPAGQWPIETVKAARAAYDESIAYLDSRLGQLFDELDRRGLRENTIIIVTSDHGEEFGEHGYFYHGNTLYRPSLEIPLMIAWPNHIPAGVIVDNPVSLRDVAATVVSLAGRPGTLPGTSLSRHWAGSGAPGAHDTLFSTVQNDPGVPANTPLAKGTMVSVILDGDRLIVNGDGTPELFDFANDPDEKVNLADDPRWGPRLRSLGSALQTSLGGTGTVRNWEWMHEGVAGPQIRRSTAPPDTVSMRREGIEPSTY